MQMYGSEAISPRTVHLSTRFTRAVGFALSPLYLQRKKSLGTRRTEWWVGPSPRKDAVTKREILGFGYAACIPSLS